MERYEQFAFVISAICAFILLLNIVGVTNLNHLHHSLLTTVTLFSIATFNIRKHKILGTILYALGILMLISVWY